MAQSSEIQMAAQRLAVLAKIKSHEAKKRLQVMTAAMTRAEATREALHAAEANMARQFIRKGMAAEYCASEMDRLRSSEIAKHVRNALEAALDTARSAHAEWTAAHIHATAVLQVANMRRSIVQRLNDAREQCQGDEWAMLRFVSNRNSSRERLNKYVT